jgi:chromosome segregation ATPase
LSDKHRSEFKEMKESMAKKEEQWMELIQAKNSDISKLKGRLEEARNARETTLEEMKVLSKNYNYSIKQLEESLEVLLEKYQTLQKQKENVAQTQSQIEEKLQKSLSEKHRLSSRLEVASNESQIKQKKIDELDSLVTRLEHTLNSFDKQVMRRFIL